MVIKEIPIKECEVSPLNSRTSLAEGQEDSTLDDLARSIEKQGLLCPITVLPKADTQYAIIAGQRRFLACQKLGWSHITAIVRYGIDEDDARALSLVENVHRADMNPHDKAVAFQALLNRLGDAQSVSQETGISVATIRKYLRLLDLAPELKTKLAAGEATNTKALGRLAKRFAAPEEQVTVWDQIDGLTQDIQVAVIRQVAPNLQNLKEVVEQAEEVAVVNRMANRCPFDCPTIPEPLKKEVARMVLRYKAELASQSHEGAVVSDRESEAAIVSR